MSDRIITLTAIFVLAFASLLLLPAPVAAAPLGGAGPEEEACAGRANGDPCALPNSTPGTCAPATCNRLDYSGGSPPKAIEEACVVCKQGPMLGDSGGEDTANAGDAPAGEDEAEANAEPSSSAVASKDPPASSSRCRVGDRTPSPAGVVFLTALLLVVRVGRSRT